MAARGPQALPRRVLGRARSSAAQGVGGGETWDLEALKKESLRAVDLPSFRQPTRLQVIEKIPAVNALLGESEDYRRVRECVDRGDTEGVESSIARRSGVGKEIGIFWYTCWLQAADSRCKRRLAPVSAAELRRVVAEVEARGIRRGPDFCLWLARVYVRLGDSPAAFETLRGMRTTGFIIDTSTLNNVLAASTNQEASVALFNHMVLTYDLQPNLKTYEHFRRLCVTDEVWCSPSGACIGTGTHLDLIRSQAAALNFCYRHAAPPHGLGPPYVSVA
ncbi:hypothetical protein DIPPA_32922 [Diplonema papillatum]|nr:hypothetical protein DIPPA_32922 [Diplonema papillatum]